MSTTTNYATNGVVRKVDLYVQGALNFDSTTRQQVYPTLAVEQGGQVCAGIVKLAQKALNTLMSYDIFYDPSWGTGFSTLIMSGNSHLIRREFNSFIVSALNLVLQELRDQETETTPADEKVQGLHMLSWSITTDALRCSIQVVSAATTSVIIVVPISVVP